MRVLVTGGAGHIGSHIVERLLKRGDEVLVIDNYQTGRRDNLQENINLRIVEDSIANTQKVFEEIANYIKNNDLCRKFWYMQQHRIKILRIGLKMRRLMW